MKVAALDLGTNSFLCLIADGDNKGLQFVQHDLMKIVRLGQDLQKNGHISSEALGRARDCLIDFKKVIDQSRVDKVLALATSATRDSSNQSEFLQILENLQIPVEIISGEREAQLSYLGATIDYRHENDKTFLIIDVGGGSTEFIVGRNGQILFSKSLNIGGVRLTEKLISQQPVSAEEKALLNECVDIELGKIIPEIKKHTIDQVLAVAGTPTSIAAIEVGGYNEQNVNNYPLTQERLKYWVNEFAHTSVETKRNKYLLGGRSDIIFSGTVILFRTLCALNLRELTVSTRGVRFGIANELFLKG